MNRQGFTLIELMVVVSLLTIVVGTLFLLANSTGEAARVQEAKTASRDQVRNAMAPIVRELRQASTSSINWSELPGSAITYSIPVDISGNGHPVNEAGQLELSPVRRIGLDEDDINDDGLTDTQAVLTEDGVFLRVLASYLTPDGTGGGDPALWFEPVDQGIRVTVSAQISAGPGNPPMRSTLQETVLPRN